MFKVRNIIAAVLVLAIGVIILNIIQQHKAENNPAPLRSHGFFSELDSPVMAAHRGASGNYPENTLLAFESALEKGVHVLEMDVRLTADNHIVVMHDETVDRTTDGEGPVSEMTLEEIKKLDAAYNFAPEKGYPYRAQGIKAPTLGEVLEAFPYVELIVEMKGREKELPEEVARIIERHEAHDRVLAASFSDATIRRFRDIMPEVASCGAIRESLTFYLLSHLGLAGWMDWDFDGLFIMPSYGPLPVYTDTLATAARASGLHIYLWTINKEEEMLDFLQAEVNGILSDYPSVLYEVVASTRENDR